jgi:DNA-binding NtrC family response regulator
MKTILVVEGDACQRESLAAALAGEYLVTAISCVRDAISVLEQHKVDGIVIAMDGSPGDGIVVLSHVAGMRPRPQVIVLTTLDQPAKAVKAMKLGVDEYVVKPCEPEALRIAVQRALAGRPEDCGSR